MNLAELRDAVAGATGASEHDVQPILAAALEIITATVAKGERVRLMGFGTFELRHRAARMVRRPNDAGLTPAAGGPTPAFRAGARFKKAVTQRVTW